MKFFLENLNLIIYFLLGILAGSGSFLMMITNIKKTKPLCKKNKIKESSNTTNTRARAPIKVPDYTVYGRNPIPAPVPPPDPKYCNTQETDEENIMKENAQISSSSPTCLQDSLNLTDEGTWSSKDIRRI